MGDDGVMSAAGRRRTAWRAGIVGLLTTTALGSALPAAQAVWAQGARPSAARPANAAALIVPPYDPDPTLGQLAAALRRIEEAFASRGPLTIWDAVPPTAFAQLAQAPDGGSGEITLEPITVQGDARREDPRGPVDGYRATRSDTATKTGTPIINTPQAINVIPQEVIEDQAARSLDEVLRNAPSVGRTGNAANVQTQQNYTIRGFPVSQTFRDGVRQRGTGPQNLDNVERVEVLKGPSSLLYGAIAPGGIINVVTKRPLATPIHEIGLEGGQFGRINPVIDSTGPLTADNTLLYRFVGSYLNADSFVDLTERERYLLAPSIRWQPRADMRLDLALEYNSDDRTFEFGVPLRGKRPDPRIPRERFLGELFNNRLDTDLNASGRFEWDITQSTSVNAAWGFHRFIHESYSFRPASAVLPDDTVRRVYSLREPAETDENQVEANLIHRFELGPMRHTLLAGFDARRSDIDSRRPQGNWISPAFSVNVLRPVYGFPEPNRRDPRISYFAPSVNTQEQWGAYVQDEAWFWDRLLLVGTVRYTEIEQRNNLPTGTTTQRDDNVSPRFGALYKLTPDTSVYASYATSFEQAVGRRANGSLFDPTEGEQYEVGLKQEFFGGKASATIAAYDLTQTNVLTPDLANPGFSVQLGEVRSRGMEFDVAGEVRPGLNLIAGYSYIDNEILTGPDKGNRNANVPKHKASFWATYDLFRHPAGVFTVGAGVFHESLRYTGITNFGELPGYVTFDIGAWYKFKLDKTQLEAQVVVRNLFDETFYYGGVGDQYAFFGEPRTVTARLTARF